MSIFTRKSDRSQRRSTEGRRVGQRERRVQPQHTAEATCLILHRLAQQQRRDAVLNGYVADSCRV